MYLYHEAPADIIFDEMKTKAVSIWNTYDNTHGYATEKIEKIEGLENIGSNFMYIFMMFDTTNQEKLRSTLSEKALEAISIRLALESI